jgi:FtsP/CotA-like multicopper oxidase with cupredoxin domain
MQYHDGLYGAFIVHPRVPQTHPVDSIGYDEEIVLILSDWFHADGSVLGASAIYAPSRVWQLNSPKSVLINGRGRYHCLDAPASNGCNSTMPYHVVTVKRGLKYRLRVICSATRVALSFAVQNHAYTVVQSQAENTAPIENVKTVHMAIGSRYDLILEANQTIGNYWIGSEVIGCTSCAGVNSAINVQPSLGLRGFAILRYEGADATEPPFPFTAREETTQPGAVVFQNDERVMPLVRRNIPQPTVRWYLNSTKISPEVHWRLNGHMFRHPTVPLIFNLKRTFPVDSLIWSVNQGDVVDVVWHSHLNMDHPLHLHGFKFWLLGHGYDPFNTTHTIAPSAMRYDTVNVAGRGWIHFRFVADRPGPWMAHCHIDFHSVELMAFVVNVIPRNRKDLELPSEFSTCDSFPAMLPQSSPHENEYGACPPHQDYRDLVSAQKSAESVILALIMLAVGVLIGVIVDRQIISSKAQRAE